MPLSKNFYIYVLIIICYSIVLNLNQIKKTFDTFSTSKTPTKSEVMTSKDNSYHALEKRKDVKSNLRGSTSNMHKLFLQNPMLAQDPNMQKFFTQNPMLAQDPYLQNLLMENPMLTQYDNFQALLTQDPYLQKLLIPQDLIKTEELNDLSKVVIHKPPTLYERQINSFASVLRYLSDENNSLENGFTILQILENNTGTCYLLVNFIYELIFFKSALEYEDFFKLLNEYFISDKFIQDHGKNDLSVYGYFPTNVPINFDNGYVNNIDKNNLQIDPDKDLKSLLETNLDSIPDGSAFVGFINAAGHTFMFFGINRGNSLPPDLCVLDPSNFNIAYDTGEIVPNPLSWMTCSKSMREIGIDENFRKSGLEEKNYDFLPNDNVLGEYFGRNSHLTYTGIVSSKIRKLPNDNVLVKYSGKNSQLTRIIAAYWGQVYENALIGLKLYEEKSKPLDVEIYKMYELTKGVVVENINNLKGNTTVENTKKSKFALERRKFFLQTKKNENDLKLRDLNTNSDNTNISQQIKENNEQMIILIENQNTNMQNEIDALNMRLYYLSLLEL